MEHYFNHGDIKKDLQTDLKPKSLKQIKHLLRFMMENPSSLLAFSPVLYVDKRWIICLYDLIMYSMLLAIIGGVMYVF